MKRQKHGAPVQSEREEVPFANAEDAWFWFVQAHEARNAGARVAGGLATVPRPCEPIDVLRTVDRLYRARRLMPDHLRVLVHYGRRRLAPDPERRREITAHGLWREALSRLEAALRVKGIII